MATAGPVLDLCIRILLAYLLGSISGSLLIGKLRGVDIRTQGSGNAGGTNAFRTQGIVFALFVVIVDVGKGILAVILIPKTPLPFQHFTNHTMTASVAVAAIAGHIWPLYYGFRGGKGMATTLGVIFILMPWALLVLLGAAIIIIILTGYVGLASIIAALGIWPVFWWLGPNPLPIAYHIAAGLITLLVIYAHRSNIQRMVAGNENRFEKARLLHRWLQRQ